jgi:hypothetical protein
MGKVSLELKEQFTMTSKTKKTLMAQCWFFSYVIAIASNYNDNFEQLSSHFVKRGVL